MKTCNGCSTEKDYLYFYKNKTTKDGFATQCKSCMSAHSKAYYAANTEELKAKSTAYRQANVEELKATAKDYYAANFDTIAAYNKAWKQANPDKVATYQQAKLLKSPEKTKARMAVSNAIRAGTLIRPNECSSCNISCKPDGHHDNYDEPLNVRWLCRKCHTAHHVELNELKEA